MSAFLEVLARDRALPVLTAPAPCPAARPTWTDHEW
jgi:hypothetical protein